MGEHKIRANAAGKPITSLIIDRLASVKFAVAVVVILAVACIVGTLLPQGAEVGKYLAKYPDATGRIELLGKLGLTHVFQSIWFIGLLCVLSASVLTCSTRRFSTVRRTTGSARGRALGSMLTHISFLLILGGAVIRGVWGEKGYLEFREGETVAQFVEDRGVKPLPFAIQLKKFEIETYAKADAQQTLLVAWPAKNLQTVLPVKLDVEQKFADFTIKVLKYIPDFTIDQQTREVTSRSSQSRNPALLVAVDSPSYRNHKWVFAKFPDYGHENNPSPLRMIFQAADEMPAGPIKSFKSTVQLPNGEHTVEVNSPLRFGGYTFYQSGYNPRDLTYTSFQVVKDPGIPVVYAGFGLMITGLAVVFYINPWLDERRKKA